MGGHKKPKDKDKDKDKKKSRHREPGHNKPTRGTSASKLAKQKERTTVPALSQQQLQQSHTRTQQTSMQSINAKAAGRGGGRSATKATKVADCRTQAPPPPHSDDDAPTMLIAPDDYCHMYAAKQPVVVGGGGGGASISKRGGGGGEIVKGKVDEHIPSDAPTALIAPDDYQNLYRAAKPAPAKALQPPKQAPVKEDSIQQMPSDAPTALIAPDDYCHIFAQSPKDANEKK